MSAAGEVAAVALYVFGMVAAVAILALCAHIVSGWMICRARRNLMEKRRRGGCGQK